MVVRKEINIGGKLLSLETGKLAKQADGSVVMQYGDTIVLCTVVAEKKPNEELDYFPLQVEYREKTSAAGKIPGGFFKREGRPTEKEILSSRIIDRPIRPMFPQEFQCETQVAVTVFSSDQENDGDILGATGASAALTISDIPFDGPIAEVRVGRIDGELIINPTFSQLEKSDMDVTVAGTRDSIVMVEGEAQGISEQEMLNALRFAQTHITALCDVQLELQRECGKPKRELSMPAVNQELVSEVQMLASPRIRELTLTVLTKDDRSARRLQIEEEIQTSLAEKYPDQSKVISQILHDIEKEEMRRMILEEQKRLDGRRTKDIRPITCEVGVLPRTHGSALFTRGETQSLTTCTLGTKMDEQILDGLLPEKTKRFMLHYNFPPFSVGEVGRFGGPGRREIGHGNLAERALKNLIPPEAEFPYTIRVVSDILESNGSSSMATVCAGSLALMDAGVPIKQTVAGIAMGLVKEGERIAILSDILGNEDHLGDMDFKVAGTRNGITAFQMDIKIQGISFDVFADALEQAREGRMKILDTMEKTIAESRKELSPYAPRLTTIKIPIDMIGAVIGPGGKMIREIVAQSGAEINIEDDGTVVIASVNGEGTAKAVEMINRITEVPEVGKVYRGRVTRIMDFGAFVEFLPGKEGLIHISHLDMSRVNKVTDLLNVGDNVEVKLIEKDKEGRYNLSRKALLPGYDPAKEAERDAARKKERTHRHDGGHRGGHREHDRRHRN
jgi:polyribonucleotide nucleotidyltransferase